LTRAWGVHAEGPPAGAICLSVRRGNKWFFHHFPTVIIHALLAFAFHPHDTIAEGVRFRLESKGHTSFIIALRKLSGRRAARHKRAEYQQKNRATEEVIHDPHRAAPRAIPVFLFVRAYLAAAVAA